MSAIDELYQQVILDHNRSPRNFQKLEDADRVAEGYNPLCGDQMTIYLQLKDEAIRNIAFQGTGCAISKASASLMTDSVKNLTTSEVEALFKKFHHMVTGRPELSSHPEELGKLAVFAGVVEFPVRVKCATLPWHTLRAALEGRKEPVTTES